MKPENIRVPVPPPNAHEGADCRAVGSILSRVRPSDRNIANYVWLIRCVGDPVFCAPNIGTGGHLGAQHSPLFVGSASNHPAMSLEPGLALQTVDIAIEAY